jgi:peptidyl-prolyl cis-trans isomerase B (cyclophilin B)
MARAKLDRQLARRAARARRRRQVQAGIGAAVALLLIVLGSVWLAGGFERDPKAAEQTAASPCTWAAQPPNDKLKDVGTPPTTGIATTGSRPMTITTNQGAPIVVGLDVAKAPCGAASMAYLAGKNFFDNTRCHEITKDGALRCGDPSGTGQGGPTYTFANENEPQVPAPDPSAPAAPPTYPKGTVAAVGTAPGSNGSQFLIFLKDFTPPDQSVKFSVLGTVTGGQPTLDKIAAMPTVDNGSGAATKPKDDIVVQSVTVGEAAAQSPPSGAPAPSATSQS